MVVDARARDGAGRPTSPLVTVVVPAAEQARNLPDARRPEPVAS